MAGLQPSLRRIKPGIRSLEPGHRSQEPGLRNLKLGLRGPKPKPKPDPKPGVESLHLSIPSFNTEFKNLFSGLKPSRPKARS